MTAFSWLPEAYQPDVFRANVQEALEECQLDGLSLEEIDCDSPPCLVVFEEHAQGNSDLGGCAWWSERYPHTGFSSTRDGLAAPDGPRLYLVHGQQLPDNQSKRTQALVDELTVRWGAKDASELDKLVAHIAHLRKVAEQEDDEVVRRTIERLEETERLVRAEGER